MRSEKVQPDAHGHHRDPAENAENLCKHVRLRLCSDPGYPVVLNKHYDSRPPGDVTAVTPANVQTFRGRSGGFRAGAGSIQAGPRQGLSFVAGERQTARTQITHGETDVKEIPDGVRAYNTTQIYTDKTTPGMMKNDHRTRLGVWGKIIVEKGSVAYEIPDQDESHVLTPDNPGIIEPAVTHRINPQPGTKFYLEFYR